MTDLVRWLSYRLRLSRPVFEHAHRSIQMRSEFISVLFKGRRFRAPPSFLSRTTFEPKSAHIRSQPCRSSPLPTGHTDDQPNLRLCAQAIHPPPPRRLRSLALIHPTMPSFSSSPHSPSSPHRPSPSSLGPPSPIVLISEPTGLVVNSVRHLPNGDVSLSFPPPYLCLCLCLCRLVFLALALGDAFFFSPSSSAHPSRVEPGITPRVWSRPR
jgi:hypothetical protein